MPPQSVDEEPYAVGQSISENGLWFHDRGIDFSEEAICCSGDIELPPFCVETATEHNLLRCDKRLTTLRTEAAAAVVVAFCVACAGAISLIYSAEVPFVFSLAMLVPLPIVLYYGARGMGVSKVRVVWYVAEAWLDRQRKGLRLLGLLFILVGLGYGSFTSFVLDDTDWSAVVFLGPGIVCFLPSPKSELRLKSIRKGVATVDGHSKEFVMVWAAIAATGLPTLNTDAAAEVQSTEMPHHGLEEAETV